MRLTPYTPLDFSQIDRQAKKLAKIIEARRSDLTDILLSYESHEVAHDEISRTLDLLTSLKENKKYFQLRVGSIAAFLPRNQPLYAFCCFVVVPSLMASEVSFRIPNSTRHFFSKMLSLLDIAPLFPNIAVSNKTRIEFLREQSALLVNPKNRKSRPLTDAVIFTGTSAHADQLRIVFDKRTLFISNGAGHNPIVISENADLSRAVDAVLSLQLYNQGQDCAAPNAILVHKNVLPPFLPMLRDGVRAVRIGHYRDKTSRVGPISDPKDLVRIQDLLIEHREWLDSSTAGIVRAADAIVEPAIICKPLSAGGNFSEIFAPIIFIQEYARDSELKDYFEDRRYARNAMYITLFGTSAYVRKFVRRPVNDKVLHDSSSLILNNHLHAPGIERGTRPYGGYGHGASSISIHGKITSMPTLPQRDIYQQIAKPVLRRGAAEKLRKEFRQYTQLQEKDVEKLLRLPPSQDPPPQGIRRSGYAHLDLRSLRPGKLRYTKIPEKNLHYLLSKPNSAYIAALKPADRILLRKLRSLLRRKQSMPFEKFHVLLFEIPKKAHGATMRNGDRQRRFFGDIYQLLFGKGFGPQLAPFLWETEQREVDGLFRV